MAEWMTSPDHPNTLLHGDGFYISYNPNTSRHPDKVKAAAADLIADLLFLIDGQKRTNTEPETALMLDGRGTPSRILVGDFRAEYEQAIGEGFAACLAVYEKHRAAHRSPWSTDEED